MPKAPVTKAQALSAAARGDIDRVRAYIKHTVEPEAVEVMFEAIEHRQAAVVRAIVAHASPVRQFNGCLVRASRTGQSDIVQMLLPHSDARDRESLALRRAIEYGHDRAVDLLLPHSDVDAHEGFALTHAIRRADTELIAKLRPWVKTVDQGDSLALRLAAAHGLLDVVQWLVPLSNPRAARSEALRTAIENGHTEVAARLLPLSSPRQAVLTWIDRIEHYRNPQRHRILNAIHEWAPSFSPRAQQRVREEARRVNLAIPELESVFDKQALERQHAQMASRQAPSPSRARL